MYKIKVTLFAAGMFAALTAAAASNDINLNAPEWLGNFKLDAKRLAAVRTATEKALDAPIDAEQQCAEVDGLCTVRAAREWKVGDDQYREIVIYLHTIGHASRAVVKANGKWPAVSAK